VMLERRIHPPPGLLGIVVDRDVDAFGDRDPRRVASCLVERVADGAHLLSELGGRRGARAEEPVTMAHRSPQRGRVAAAEPQRRVRLLGWVWVPRRAPDPPETGGRIARQRPLAP